MPYEGWTGTTFTPSPPEPLSPSRPPSPVDLDFEAAINRAFLAEETLQTHPVLGGCPILRRSPVNPDLCAMTNDNKPTGSTRVEDGSYATSTAVPQKECEFVGNPWLAMANGGVQDEVESIGSDEYLERVKALSKDFYFGPNYHYKPGPSTSKARHISNESKESAQTSFKVLTEKKKLQPIDHFTMKRFVDGPTNPPFNILDPPPFLAEAQLTNYPGFEDVEKELVEGHWVETDIDMLRTGWVERVNEHSRMPQSATFASKPKPELSPKKAASVHGDPSKKPKPKLTLNIGTRKPEEVNITSPTPIHLTNSDLPKRRFRHLNPLNLRNPIVAKAASEDPQTFTIEGLVCSMAKLFHPMTLPMDIVSQLPDKTLLSDLSDPDSPVYAEFHKIVEHGVNKKMLCMSGKEAVYLAFYIDTMGKKMEGLEEKCKALEEEMERAREEVVEAECAVREVFGQHLGFESVADRVVLRWKLLEREVGVLAAAATATTSPTRLTMPEGHERKKSDSGTAARFLAKELGKDLGVFVKTVIREKEDAEKGWARKAKIQHDNAMYWKARAEAAEARMAGYERLDSREV